jgi:hypothetical protein
LFQNRDVEGSDPTTPPKSVGWSGKKGSPPLLSLDLALIRRQDYDLRS